MWIVSSETVPFLLYWCGVCTVPGWGIRNWNYCTFSSIHTFYYLSYFIYFFWIGICRVFQRTNDLINFFFGEGKSQVLYFDFDFTRNILKRCLNSSNIHRVIDGQLSKCTFHFFLHNILIFLWHFFPQCF